MQDEVEYYKKVVSAYGKGTEQVICVHRNLSDLYKDAQNNPQFYTYIGDPQEAVELYRKEIIFGVVGMEG